MASSIDTIRQIRLMRLLSMMRKVMAEMVEDELDLGLNTEAGQREYIRRHQQFNDEWWSCFRPMHIDDYTPQHIFEQLEFEMRLLYLHGDYPGQEAVVPTQIKLHDQVEERRKERRKK